MGRLVHAGWLGRDVDVGDDGGDLDSKSRKVKSCWKGETDSWQQGDCDVMYSTRMDQAPDERNRR